MEELREKDQKLNVFEEEMKKKHEFLKKQVKFHVFKLF